MPSPAWHGRQGGESPHVWRSFRASCWQQRNAQSLDWAPCAVPWWPELLRSVVLGSLAGCLLCRAIPHAAFLPSMPNEFTTALLSGRSMCASSLCYQQFWVWHPFFFSFPKHQGVDCRLPGGVFSLPLDGRRNNCRENCSESCSAQE